MYKQIQASANYQKFCRKKIVFVVLRQSPKRQTTEWHLTQKIMGCRGEFQFKSYVFVVLESFWHFIPPGTQTLNLGMKRLVFCHCATITGIVVSKTLPVLRVAECFVLWKSLALYLAVLRMPAVLKPLTLEWWSKCSTTVLPSMALWFQRLNPFSYFGLFCFDRLCALCSWAQCYKTFYDRNLQLFIISETVCYCQAFPAYSNVCG